MTINDTHTLDQGEIAYAGLTGIESWLESRATSSTATAMTPSRSPMGRHQPDHGQSCLRALRIRIAK